jgi:hypothetical protein
VKLIYPVKKCPHCDGELYRSHRRGVVESVAFRPLLIRAYRCDQCGQRYYMPPTLVFESSRPAIPTNPALRNAADD